MVDYAQNPHKTIYSDLRSVLHYAANMDKTTTREEQAMFVTGVNCNQDTAFQEMQVLKERFGKTGGDVAYHAYQSSKPGEVTPERCHRLGVKLIKRMWGEEYQLSTIRNLKRKTSRSIYFAERNGESIWYNLMREAMDAARKVSVGGNDLWKALRERGTSWTITPPTNTPPYSGFGTKRRYSFTGWGRHTICRPPGSALRKTASGTPAISVIIGTGLSPFSGSGPSGPDTCVWTALLAV